jgi:uncharacterized protein YndB with AHSA1/START domain
MTIHAEHRYHLDTPPETAFAYLSDPSHDAEWQGSCVEAQLIDAAPVAVGTRYRILFSFMGRKTPFVGRVTELSPHTEYAFESVEGPFAYHGRYSFRPAAEGGVDVHWQFWTEPGRFFGLIPATLLRKVLVTQVEKDVVGLRKRLA